jgi:peptide/nickel transport system substrate-binding protein
MWRNQAVPLGVAFLIASCAPTTGTSSPGAASATPRSGGKIVYATQSSSAIATDPINATSVGIAMAPSIYDSLYRFKVGGGTEPALAEKTDVSSDGLTWTLTLRKGVRFHDETVFDATAAKANIDVRKSHPTFSLKAQIAPIKEVKVVDSGAVQLLLSAPTPALDVILSSASFGIYSPTALAKYPDKAEYARHAAGTGPFKLEGTPTELSVTLVRNDDYWAAKPYLDRVEWRVITDVSARIAALEAGDVDVIDGLENAGPELERLRKESKVTVRMTPLAESVVYLIFNTAKPSLANQAVRQAIVNGLNSKTYLAMTYGAGEIADSMVAPYVTGYDKSTPYPYDPAKAKQALTSAGVQRGARLTIFGKPIFSDLNTLVQQDLNALGFEATIRTLDNAGWNQAVAASAADSAWDVAIGGIGVAYADAEAVLIRQFLSTNDAPKGANWSHYKNGALDELLKQQGVTVDPAARIRLLAQIQKILWTDVPWYPLVRTRYAYGTSKFIHDIAWLASRADLSRTWVQK